MPLSPAPNSVITSCTWPTRPANPQLGDRIRLTDYRNNICAWNGSVWTPQSMWSQQSIPVGIPSSGTIGANGALTLATALPRIYSEGVFLYFPAGAINAGSAAGYYWAVMSSTTAGTVYNNTYSGIVDPAIPAVLAPFVGTNGAAYTQDLIEITARSIVVPGGLLGPNGSLDVDALLQASLNNANSKLARYKFGGIQLNQSSLASLLSYQAKFIASNRGALSRQVTNGSVGTPYGGIGSFAVFTSIDTSADQTLTVTLQLAVATDALILDRTRVMVAPA